MRNLGSQRWRRASVIALGLLVALAASPATAEPFDPGCVLPFDAIKVEHPIDGTCGREGDASTAKKKAQNLAKSNFCAPSPAARVTLVSFQRLQNKVTQLGIPFGSASAMPTDRAVLRDIYTTTDGMTIGEGSRVVYVGFIVKAKAAGKESCNCSETGVENTDIHVSLGRTHAEPKCKTITAEISPHFRPDLWTVGALNQIESHPVRISGHLFFDSVHKLCNGTEPIAGQPARVSLWEIHPVYSCEVCVNTSISGCPWDDDSKWRAIGDVVEEEAEE
ncbi:MAG: hypothetical protein HOP12_07545 [Candidatus Eisenbacteria bacterium]|uniref:Secreted protein n=1 Tax=Eiseniibacteriota bacterium TaxID=2212470 RepID=A0A849SMG3_UNCEI|nr:hypothetical protein [Candidatus Eisenbacteria bacterium]